MARRENVRLLGLSAEQAMVLGVALAASEAAGEAAGLGGYKPTDAAWDRLRRAIEAAAFALVAQVDWTAAPSEEQLEAAARDLGLRVLREILGPPPMAH